MEGSQSNTKNLKDKEAHNGNHSDSEIEIKQELLEEKPKSGTATGDGECPDQDHENWDEWNEGDWAGDWDEYEGEEDSSSDEEESESSDEDEEEDSSESEEEEDSEEEESSDEEEEEPDSGEEEEEDGKGKGGNDNMALDEGSV